MCICYTVSSGPVATDGLFASGYTAQTSIDAQKSVVLLLQDKLLRIAFQQEQAISNNTLVITRKISKDEGGSRHTRPPV